MDDSIKQQVGWRLTDWMMAAGNPFSIPTFYKEVAAGRIEVCKVGPRTTIVLTSPADYFAKLPRGVGESPRKWQAA